MTTTTTAQGTLHLDCIASDPSSSYLYGIASANTGTPSYTTDSTIVLVRSNYNPTSLAAITWTIISTTEGKQFSYNYLTFTSVDCAANDKGHFAAFFRSPYRTASPFKLLPMGVRYDPAAKEKGEGAWSPIWGSAMYGWNVDRFVHRSFYQGDELVHLLTGDVVDSLQLGRVDYSTNMLQLGSIQTRQQVDVFLLSYTFDNMVWVQDFDYTQKGFFPDYTGFFPQKVALHNGTFYVTNSEDQNVTCVYQGVRRRIEEVRGGLYSKMEWALGDYHVFAGLRQGLIFFGGIYKEDYRDGNPTAPPLMPSEKHEVYSSRMILEEIKELEDEEEDSSSDNMPNSAGRSSGRMKRSARHSGSVSKRPGMLADTGRLPSYTYQDQIEELDFSSHPRPNVVTTVGDQNIK
ncbi:hypothetical protein EC957_003417 [Mortierella hygrophila]|uniref:Uncharacterized protein n=1 Tax=Mortierella hygrophila TaxID=979708 RepID=A0A9P6F356_9FUNG|nr:hypothetical protein EC957_003417 [Mortierella hygrophila]